MANYLVILNDPPYGTERSYNGLRLARALATKGETVKLRGRCNGRLPPAAG